MADRISLPLVHLFPPDEGPGWLVALACAVVCLLTLAPI